MIHNELTIDRDEVGYYLSLLLPSLETFKMAPIGYAIFLTLSGFSVILSPQSLTILFNDP
jgi:hypothetical protein